MSDPQSPYLPPSGQQPPWRDSVNNEPPTEVPGQPPAYGSPTYGTPSYGAPSSGAPTYGTPSSGAPTYGTPSSGAPSYGTPAGPTSYGPPAYGAPNDEPPTYVPTSQPGAGQPYAQPGTYGQPPTYGQPSAYGQPPTYGQPSGIEPTTGQPAQGYAQSGYGASGYPAPGGYAPAPKRSRTGLWVGLAIGVVVLLALCVGGAVMLLRSGDDKTTGTGTPTAVATTRPPAAGADAEKGATVSTPATLAGLTLSKEPSLQKTAEDLEAELKSSIPNASSAAAGTYQDPSDPTALVMVAVVAVDNDTPEALVSGAFVGMRSQLDVKNVKDIDPGPMGGIARCGTATMQGMPLTVCVWGDHGSLGQIYFLNRSLPESQKLYPDIRKGVLHRK
ncbi:hypothetical protein [Luedemannella helvata]|uniref:Flagellar basal body-associated protein FliL n=1 Tax=Luedemannella helvata TaxID=349315 RepID=A0ABN2KKM8_9ACTN